MLAQDSGRNSACVAGGVGGGGINHHGDVLQKWKYPQMKYLKYQGAQVISGCHCWFEKNHFGTDMSFAQWMVADVS